MVDASPVHICLYVATLHVSVVLCKGFGDDNENVPQVVSGDCGRMMAIVLQFAAHARPRCMLLATAAAALVEVSSHDYYWGHGVDGSGANQCASGASRSAAECNRVLCSCVGWQQCGRRGRCAHSSMSMLLLVMLTLPCTVWVRLAEHVQQVGVFERIID